MLRKTNPRTVWLLLYLWATYLLTRLFADFSSLTGYPTMSLNAMVNGTAVRPFVSRALVPILIRWITAHTSEFFQYQVMIGATSRGFATEFYVHGYTLEKALLLALTFCFYFATALIIRALARRYYGLGEAASWCAGLASLAFIPLLFTYYNHIYDPPTIFFSAAMLMACTSDSTIAFCLPASIAKPPSSSCRCTSSSISSACVRCWPVTARASCAAPPLRCSVRQPWLPPGTPSASRSISDSSTIPVASSTFISWTTISNSSAPRPLPRHGRSSSCSSLLSSASQDGAASRRLSAGACFSSSFHCLRVRSSSRM
jgi:hypothetical protein